MLRRALTLDGPAALRYARGCEGAFKEDTSAADVCVLHPGTDVTIISYGVLMNPFYTEILCIKTAETICLSFKQSREHH